MIAVPPMAGAFQSDGICMLMPGALTVCVLPGLAVAEGALVPAAGLVVAAPVPGVVLGACGIVNDPPVPGTVTPATIVPDGRVVARATVVDAAVAPGDAVLATVVGTTFDVSSRGTAPTLLTF